MVIVCIFLLLETKRAASAPPQPPPPQGNLSCAVINDKLYFRFELPVTLGKYSIAKNYNFFLFQCRNKESQLPPTNYIHNEGGRTINALVGAYDSSVLLYPLCVQIEERAAGKLVMQMRNFKVKSTQRLVGRAWNIFDQFHCFKGRGWIDDKQSSVRYMSVTEDCTNLTVTWLNDKFDEYWFIRKQRISITEVTVIKTNDVTKIASRAAPYKQQQQQQQQHYHHEEDVNFMGDEKRYVKRDLKPNTEYRVCVITDYGPMNGSKRKCTMVYNFCRRKPESNGENNKKPGGVWIKMTAILSGVTVGAFLGVCLLVVGVQRKVCDYCWRDNDKNDFIRSRDDIVRSRESSGDDVCARPPIAYFVDERELMGPLEYHEYYQIKS